MSTLLFHRELLAGVDPRVTAFFDWWALEGPFPLRIADGGGLRTDAAAQAALYAAGRSRARTLAQTAHGRGGGADAYPVRVIGGRRGIYLSTDGAAALERFQRYGELAEARGLKWGGRWLRAFPPHGDCPHVEVPGWKMLPYPPAPIARYSPDGPPGHA